MYSAREIPRSLANSPLTARSSSGSFSEIACIDIIIAHLIWIFQPGAGALATLNGEQGPIGFLRICIILAILLVTGACVRRDGRNADCRWPAESQLATPSAWHLASDAELAEDLAIRYADTHHGLRTTGYVSGEAYVAARDRCLGTLFEAAALAHGIPAERVARALGANRAAIDTAVNLPFLLFSGVAAWFAARWVWRRYPLREGWTPGAVMTLFLALSFAFASVMLGEMWSWFVEGWRLGNGHMSYRAIRLPWARYRTELWTGMLLLFIAVAALAARGRPAGA